MAKKLELIHPGEILLEEFMRPLHLSQNYIARALGVPPGRINDIVLGRRSITLDTAARLSLFFGTTPDLWLNLQAHYDAKLVRRKLLPELARHVRPMRAA